MTPEQWREIEELYHAAKNCRDDERAALLEFANPDIRARVERMLEVESGSGILDEPSAMLLAELTKASIAPGEQLGPYRIEGQIGSGGMGTVYRAVDTRLGRTVAIKTAAGFYSERFQREAQAISRLNHPHICTLHDVGPDYLVMEFIEGPTLAAEIRKGPLAPATAARYCAQIANALAEAHSLGIVHRDLKPPNVMLTRHGVKVLDFGLARMPQTAGVTETGAIAGTPAYMAPEQVEGRPPKPASDLFALGLVLFEMSVGRLPFPGASLGQMLSSGAHTPVPAPSRERAGVPASLDAIVARLLERDPGRRPQSAAEVARELARIADRRPPPPHRSRLRFVYGLAALGLLLAVGAIFHGRRKAPAGEAPAPASTVPNAWTQLTGFTDFATGPVLSPDGRMLAFYRSANPFGATGQIWLKLLPNGEPVQITHDSREKYNIAFSPDGARIAYSVFPDPRNLFRTYTVSSFGGDSELFLPNAAGLSWLDDGRLLFSQIKSGIHMGVVTSKPDRSGLREVYFPAVERGMAHYSYLSPDKRWVLLAEMNPAWQPCRVAPFSGSSAGRQVGPEGAPCTSAAWSPDGKWIYLGVEVAGRNHLWRQRFPDGAPEQITFGSGEEYGIAMAPDGRSLITSVVTRQNSVWIHDPHGARAISNEGYAEPARPVFSRDGKRLYYLLRRDSPESAAELWRADLDSGKSQVLVPGVSMREFDISDDEKEVVYSRQMVGQPSELWVASLDREAPPRRIGAGGERNPRFGLNGDVLFRLTEGRSYYIGVMRADGTGRRKALPEPILDFRGISPDRRFVAVNAAIPNVSPPPTLILPLDGGPPIRICEALCAPAWSPNGKYLYLDAADESPEWPNGQTAAIPISASDIAPRLNAELTHGPAGWARIRGARMIDRSNVAPGASLSVYAYIKASVHANLFRLGLR